MTYMGINKKEEENDKKKAKDDKERKTSPFQSVDKAHYFLSKNYIPFFGEPLVYFGSLSYFFL